MMFKVEGIESWVVRKRAERAMVVCEKGPETDPVDVFLASTV